MDFCLCKCHNALGQHVWMGTRGTAGGRWKTGKGGERENNFPRAPAFCSHFAIDFFFKKRWGVGGGSGKKNASATILRYFPLNPHNLLVSGRAVGFVLTCVHLRVCSSMCVWPKNLNPCQDSNPG